VKRNGVFRARLVACGYSQVPGVDFTQSFALVINDVSFRLMLISKLVWDMTSTVVDIETTFLHGNLDKEIYMDDPNGPIYWSKQEITSTWGYLLVQTRNYFYEKESTV
jgi:hypothetical protein